MTASHCNNNCIALQQQLQRTATHVDTLITFNALNDCNALQQQLQRTATHVDTLIQGGEDP